MTPRPGPGAATSMIAGLCALVMIGIGGYAPSQAADPPFEAYWHDGKAELDGYRLTVERYGHARRGHAVAIYVTEPFSRSRHVKLDDPAKTPADAVDVLKLNLVRDFQTGIYDYHTLISLFVQSADFAPLKLAFTGSEWCGQVYEQLDRSGSRLSQRISSYFEGESIERKLEVPAGGVMEDELFILLRGLRAPYLSAGAGRTVPFLASPFHRRLAHREAAWTSARIERLARAETITVPAGTFATDIYTVRTGDGREGRFFVERAHPHRIVRWAWQPAEAGGRREGTDSAELTGSRRLEYWRLHGPGDERLLEQLGLDLPARPATAAPARPLRAVRRTRPGIRGGRPGAWCRDRSRDDPFAVDGAASRGRARVGRSRMLGLGHHRPLSDQS